MGVTVLFPSGDSGVGGYCLTPSGDESPDGTIFDPDFPSTCPYVTSVGATQINPGAKVWYGDHAMSVIVLTVHFKVTDPESACQGDIISGGGFSNYFPRPSYQEDAVQHYLTNYPPPYPDTIWNNTGTRGFPDIAANGSVVFYFSYRLRAHKRLP